MCQFIRIDRNAIIPLNYDLVVGGVLGCLVDRFLCCEFWFFVVSG